MIGCLFFLCVRTARKKRQAGIRWKDTRYKEWKAEGGNEEKRAAQRLSCLVLLGNVDCLTAFIAQAQVISLLHLGH